MDLTDRPRFAIYFTPGDQDPLWRLGASWLGRDARTGHEVGQPELPGFSPERFSTLTAKPRGYGFHATLKPPFRLNRGVTLKSLEERCEAFAKELPPIHSASLKVGQIDDFVAIVAAEPNKEIWGLAAASVESFDDLREPPSAEELRRRRTDGLSPQQAALLGRWGYPYVMEEFRFHMTLSAPLEDQEERESLAILAKAHFGASLERPIAIDAISLFAQPSQNAPFRELSRFSLAARC